MGITEKQRELRKKHLGSSDMAALLGVNRFANAFDIWLEKTGKLTDEDLAAKKEYIRAGNYFEDGVLSWAEDELGPLRKNQYRIAVGFPIGSNVDAIVQLSGEPVESKTGGLFGPLVGEWGEDGSDEIPDYILVQSHVHMLCCDKEVCHVAAFLGGRGFLMFHIKADKEVMDTIRETSIDFWENHVQADIPPEDIMPSLVIAKRMRREPKKTKEINPKLVTRWLDDIIASKSAEMAVDGSKAEILAAMGDAEGATYGKDKLLTFLEQTTRRIDSKRLKKERPEIAAKYVSKSTFRVLREKKPKKPKVEI